MKAYEVIGYTYEGAMYHEGCEPSVPDRDALAPVFASSELEPLDYCEHCLAKAIAANPGKSVRDNLHIYMDEWAASEVLAR